MSTIDDLKAAAQAGNPDAQVSLGYQYDSGELVPQDYEKAVYWYRQAAESGHANAEFNYAEMLRDGVGVEKSIAAAVHWYRQAAMHGNAKAAYCLGVLYASGKDIPADLVQAYAWLCLAEDGGASGATKAKEIISEALGGKRGDGLKLAARFRNHHFDMPEEIEKPASAESAPADDRFVSAVAEFKGAPLYLRFRHASFKNPQPEQFPYKLAFAMPVKQPTTAGVPTADELEQLNAAEDLLRLEVPKLFRGLHCMTLTTGLMREVVFYVQPQPQAIEIADRIAQKITHHAAQVNYEPEPHWESFRFFTQSVSLNS